MESARGGLGGAGQAGIEGGEKSPSWVLGTWTDREGTGVKWEEKQGSAAFGQCSREDTAVSVVAVNSGEMKIEEWGPLFGGAWIVDPLSDQVFLWEPGSQ